MRNVSTWLVVAALLSPVPALAQDAGLAQKAVTLSVAPGLDGRISRMIGEAVAKLPADKQAQARADLTKASVGIREDLVSVFSSYYARSFTADELKAIVAFFESPVGKKLVQVEENKPAEVNTAIQQQIMKMVAAANAAR
ncbi:DUF2059 domain-containing protein [Xanthobacter sp. V3C-3]|uniref:DUF2059 domain-containing protein n=1 Tax=Xanthobacter lutulentifluminis TaxID=3119935 RepID=UPI00372CCF5D